MNIQAQDLIVQQLGECRYRSPLQLRSASHPHARFFVDESEKIRFDIRYRPSALQGEPLLLEQAGPRERIFFDPARTTAAIVTCGGLSPGLNNVIHSAYHELSENYGVGKVLGIRNGYLGLDPQSGLAPIGLDNDFVEGIDKLGGTVLGSSRGPQKPEEMADFLIANHIDILFCVGGDGTQRGAAVLHEELQRRRAAISVVGIPKTIDNDIPFVHLSFGYSTALERASEVIRGAHVEARGAINGIGMVKLMGRHAGFIAAGATVISQEVDFALLPELPFPLEGENGFLPALERRMRNRAHAVVVVAEGAGQHLVNDGVDQRDASGNLLHDDIGYFLQAKIKNYFAARRFPISLKYIDPSYYIRSVPANVFDRYLSDLMARHAVHAAMAGKTGLMIGYQHAAYFHVPIPVVVRQSKVVDMESDLGRAVLAATGQPRW